MLYFGGGRAGIRSGCLKRCAVGNAVRERNSERNNREEDHHPAPTEEASFGQLLVSNQRHCDVTRLCQRSQIIQYRLN